MTGIFSGRIDMKTRREKLTLERLKELLHYDPETGVFTWIKASYRNERRIGTTAGCTDPVGYIRIGIDGVQYWAHRLAWFYVNGVYPENVIDHRNRNKSDNRISNLRDVPHQMNMQNMKDRKGRTLPRGVVKRNSKYAANISVNGKPVRIGTFETAEEAHRAYMKVRQSVYL